MVFIKHVNLHKFHKKIVVHIIKYNKHILKHQNSQPTALK